MSIKERQEWFYEQAINFRLNADDPHFADVRDDCLQKAKWLEEAAKTSEQPGGSVCQRWQSDKGEENQQPVEYSEGSIWRTQGGNVIIVSTPLAKHSCGNTYGRATPLNGDPEDWYTFFEGGKYETSYPNHELDLVECLGIPPSSPVLESIGRKLFEKIQELKLAPDTKYDFKQGYETAKMDVLDAIRQIDAVKETVCQ